MKLFGLSFLLTAMLLSGTAWSEPSPFPASFPKTKVERGAPPQTTEQLRGPVLPQIFERRLDNGIPVYIAVRSKLPVEKLDFVFPDAGCKNNPAGQYGLAQIMAECMGLGAGERGALAFAEARDLLGAEFRTMAYCDYLNVRVSCISRKLPETLDLAADLVICPAFAQPELKRLQKETVDSYGKMKTRLYSLTYYAFERLLFGQDSPYSYRAYPSPEQVTGLTRQDLCDYHRRHCSPDKMFICCCGNVDPDKLVELLNKRFGKWKPAPAQNCSDGAKQTRPAERAKPQPRYVPADMAEKKTPVDGRLFIIDRPGAAQSIIVAGYLGFNAQEASRLDIQAVNTLLGGGTLSSRLNQNLRERSGYTYGATSGFHSFADCGYFSCTAAVQTDKTLPALREMLKEVEAMHQPVPADELRRTLNYMIGEYSSQFERNTHVLEYLTETKIFNYPKDYADTYAAKAMQLTPGDIKRAADRVLEADKMLLLIGGDAQALEPQLREAGWKAQVLTADEVMR